MTRNIHDLRYKAATKYSLTYDWETAYHIVDSNHDLFGAWSKAVLSLGLCGLEQFLYALCDAFDVGVYILQGGVGRGTRGRQFY